MKKVAIILVNYHSEKDLEDVTSSLNKSSIPSGFQRKIFVVDNGSVDDGWGEVIRICEKYKDIECIRSIDNTGFSGGNNIGIKRAMEWGADYVLLLNVDTTVEKKFLVEMVKVMEREKSVGHLGVMSPKIYFYPGFEFHKKYKKGDLGKVIWYGGGIVDFNNIVGKGNFVDEVDRGKFGKDLVETGFATGCCLFIPREIIERVGMLDEVLFFSWEDTDFSERVRRAGYKVWYLPTAFIWHKNAHTSGGAGSPIQDFYQTRNRLIFAFRYATFKVKVLLLLVLLRGANWNRLKAILSGITSLVV